MTRPHVRKHFADFPWIPGEQLWGADGNNPADFDIPDMGLVRVLSKDEETGAITLLIKLQAGWHTPARERRCARPGRAPTGPRAARRHAGGHPDRG